MKFEIAMVVSVIAGIAVLGTSLHAQNSVTYTTDHWVVHSVAPRYDPVYVRSGRRVVFVDEDGGLKQCVR